MGFGPFVDASTLDGGGGDRDRYQNRLLGVRVERNISVFLTFDNFVEGLEGHCVNRFAARKREVRRLVNRFWILRNRFRADWIK